MPLSGISIALCLLCLFYLLPSFAACWQELVVEQDGNAIAYVHFSKQAKCSVLYNIHIEPQYQQQEVSRLLLTYLSRKITSPLYFHCPRIARDFYINLGFTPASRHEIPWELKILQFSNQIPIKLSNQTAAELFVQLAPSLESSYSAQTIASQRTNLKIQHPLVRKWISIAIIIVLIYAIAPLFQLAQVYLILTPQTQVEHPNSN